MNFIFMSGVALFLYSLYKNKRTVPTNPYSAQPPNWGGDHRIGPLNVVPQDVTLTQLGGQRSYSKKMGQSFAQSGVDHHFIRNEM